MDKTTFSIVLLSGQTVQGTWPNDELWIERNRRRRLIQRSVKGETTHDVENGDEADLELFRAVVGDAQFSDAAEASLAVEQLAEANVMDIQREGDAFEIELSTFLGTKSIELKRPTAAQVKKYRSFVTPVDLAHGRTLLRTNLSIPAAIFEELGGEKTLPIIHKVAACSAVINEAQRPLESSNRP